MDVVVGNCILNIEILLWKGPNIYLGFDFCLIWKLNQEKSGHIYIYNQLACVLKNLIYELILFFFFCRLSIHKLDRHIWLWYMHSSNQSSHSYGIAVCLSSLASFIYLYICLAKLLYLSKPAIFLVRHKLKDDIFLFFLKINK